MTQLKMLSADDKLTEIRRLYFNTAKSSIQQDLAKALELLKSMETEDERERATVYMEGLAEMQKDWLKQAARPKLAGGSARGAGPRTPGGAGTTKATSRSTRPARPKGPGKPAGPARPRGKAR